MLLQEGQVEQALTVFQSAGAMEADCVEAAYNSGCAVCGHVDDWWCVDQVLLVCG